MGVLGDAQSDGGGDTLSDAGSKMKTASARMWRSLLFKGDSFAKRAMSVRGSFTHEKLDLIIAAACPWRPTLQHTICIHTLQHFTTLQHTTTQKLLPLLAWGDRLS